MKIKQLSTQIISGGLVLALSLGSIITGASMAYADDSSNTNNEAYVDGYIDSGEQNTEDEASLSTDLYISEFSAFTFNNANDQHIILDEGDDLTLPNDIIYNGPWSTHDEWYVSDDGGQTWKKIDWSDTTYKQSNMEPGEYIYKHIMIDEKQNSAEQLFYVTVRAKTVTNAIISAFGDPMNLMLCISAITLILLIILIFKRRHEDRTEK